MLGYEPFVTDMVIIAGQDFSHFFGVTDDDPIPPGTTVILKIYTRDGSDQIGAWPAIDVQPGGAHVQITSVDLDAIPDSATYRVFVSYTEPSEQTLCWFRGRVHRRF